jgi:2-hydroxychromene-2-carboxylate isomerase
MSLTIDYFVSLNSPWTHLGAARIEDLADRHGANLQIWPVDFGAIFAGSGGLPLPRRSPQRQAYRLQELARWRDHLGIPIQIRPKHFPAKELPAASIVIAVRETLGHAPAIRLAHRILRACWEEDLDTGDLPTLERLLDEVELDAPRFLALGQESRFVSMRESDTQAALDRGVFGAPSYVIGEDIFWGQDRLEFVARRLARG